MLDKPEVFVSYSRTVPGDEPAAAAGLASALSWRGRTIATALLGPLTVALEARGWHVWRDDDAMTPGDELGHKIDASLLSCGGAVILLDREALKDSNWVRLETSILTWRRRIEMPVRVVPVLIGVDPSELERAGYGPTRVGDVLAEMIPLADVDPSDPGFNALLTTWATRIAADLGEVESDPLGPVAMWVDGIAACLPDDDGWIPHLAALLGTSGSRLLLSPKPRRAMARELLAGETARLQNLLMKLDQFPFKAPRRLKRHLEPVWLPADAATRLHEITQRPPGQRLLAVNAAEPGTGSDVVRRASPVISPARQILEVSVAAASPAEASSVVDDAIFDKWCGDSPAKILKDHGACFIVISFGGGRMHDARAVLDALLLAHPEATWIVTVKTSQSYQLERLEPDLQDGADDRKKNFDSALTGLLMN